MTCSFEQASARPDHACTGFPAAGRRRVRRVVTLAPRDVHERDERVMLGVDVRNVLELPPAPTDRPTAVVEHGAAEVAAFDASGRSANWLVLTHGPHLRLAVLDGEAHAAEVTRSSLRTDDDIDACVRQASKMLHGHAPAAVVADVRTRWDGDASARVVRVQRGAAFARFGDRWTSLFAPAVGRCARSRDAVEATDVEAFDELVLASEATVVCWRRAGEPDEVAQ
jgi:hypothetical protein